MSAGFVVLLTFAIGVEGHPFYAQKDCPDLACVHQIEAAAPTSRYLERLRVWAKPNFAMLPGGKQFVWPPIIDRRYT